MVAWIYSKWFDLPLYSMVPFITERLTLETDFVNEAKNSETMRELIEQEPSLRGRVYIPKVYPKITTKHVMTAERIDGGIRQLMGDLPLRSSTPPSAPSPASQGSASPVVSYAAASQP